MSWLNLIPKIKANSVRGQKQMQQDNFVLSERLSRSALH